MDIAAKHHTSSTTMKKIHANLTSQKKKVLTHLSSTQSLNLRENITKNFSASSSSENFGQKSQSRAQVAPFCQQLQASSQPAGIRLRCILARKAFFFLAKKKKTLPQANLIFSVSLWPGFNNTLKLFQSLKLLNENLIFASWSLVRQSSCFVAPPPWTTNCQ